MDTLQNMRVFVRVVEAGSFTAAAQHLNTTTAYASRAVSDLEAHLRTRLLNRTTRRIALTEAGERYLQRCEQILAYVDQAEAEAGDAHARPSGKLKVHAMTGFGQHYVVPMISRYQARLSGGAGRTDARAAHAGPARRGLRRVGHAGFRLARLGARVAAAGLGVQHRVRVAGLSREARHAARAVRPGAPHLSATGDARPAHRQMDLRRPERPRDDQPRVGDVSGERRRSDGGGRPRGHGRRRAADFVGAAAVCARARSCGCCRNTRRRS